MQHNKTIKDKILLESKIKEFKTRKISSNLSIENIEWYDFSDYKNWNYDHLKQQKGVYIIWNRNKDMYYVGQSKDLGTRLAHIFKVVSHKN